MNAFLLHRIRGVNGRRKAEKWPPKHLTSLISPWYVTQNFRLWSTKSRVLEIWLQPCECFDSSSGCPYSIQACFRGHICHCRLLRGQVSFGQKMTEKKKNAAIPIPTHRKSTERLAMHASHYRTAFNTNAATESNELFHHFGSEINVNLTGDLM